MLFFEKLFAPNKFTVMFAGICALILTMGIARYAFTPMIPYMHEQAGMTDNLRDRIARVLHERLGKELWYADAPWHEVNKRAWLADADAVIKALNLDVATTYLSADKLRREVCVEGY